MDIVVGGTGHVGSAVAQALLDAGEAVTIVARDAAKGEALRSQGARIATADVHDVARLREIFHSGRRAFLLNPPADVAGDTDVEERRTVACLLEALAGSGLEKVVAESAMGARAGERIGDLSVLHELEEGLKRQDIPAAIIRAAYYFSNWDAMIEPADEQGVLPTMIPAELKLPMVAPQDLGRVAARLLMAPVTETGTYPVEGPRRYSPADVAKAFADALGHEVKAQAAPRDEWEARYRSLGFSEPAARSYARMTAVTVDHADFPAESIRGETTLETYIGQLVQLRRRR